MHEFYLNYLNFCRKSWVAMAIPTAIPTPMLFHGTVYLVTNTLKLVIEVISRVLLSLIFIIMNKIETRADMPPCGQGKINDHTPWCNILVITGTVMISLLPGDGKEVVCWVCVYPYPYCISSPSTPPPPSPQGLQGGRYVALWPVLIYWTTWSSMPPPEEWCSSGTHFSWEPDSL